MDNTVIILDAYKTHQISGQLVKRYPLGLTIDDDRGIRHYATYDRVISQPAPPTGSTRTHQQMDLF